MLRARVLRDRRRQADPPEVSSPLPSLAAWTLPACLPYQRALTVPPPRLRYDANLSKFLTGALRDLGYKEDQVSFLCPMPCTDALTH